MTSCVRPAPRYLALWSRFQVLAALSLAPLLLGSGCKCSGDPSERGAPGEHRLTLAYVAIDGAMTEICPVKPPPDGSSPIPDALQLTNEEFLLVNSRKVNDEAERLRLAAIAARRDGGAATVPPPPPTVPNPNDAAKAKLEKETATRKGACENILRDLEAMRPASSADVAAVGYTHRIQFEKHLIHERRLILCNAVRLGSENACQLFPDPNEREHCVRETGFFIAARRAPADTAWRFHDGLMGDCMRIPKMDAASCAHFRDAVRASNPSGCPNVDADVNSFCRALASLDPKLCTSKRFDGCASEIARAQTIAKSGLQGLVGSNAKEKPIAAAALGVADACEPLSKEWLEACKIGEEMPKSKVIPGPLPASAK